MADNIAKGVIAAFVTVAKAVEYKPGDGKPRWSITALVEPGSATDKQIEADILKAAEAEWGKDAAKILKGLRGQKMQDCYRSGDSAGYAGFENKMALACHRAQFNKSGSENAPPLLVGRDGKTAVNASQIYGGAKVSIKYSIWAQKGDTPGIRASFSAVQFLEDGEAFGQSAPTADGFEELGEAASQDMV